MFQILSLVVFLLLNMQNGVQGYMVDDDCGSDKDFVKRSIDSAFRMIANAVTEPDKTPLNTDVDDWHNTMFGQPYSAATGRTIRRRFKDLEQISQFTDQHQTRPGGPVDVRFYCSMKRIVKKKDGVYWNKDRNIAYKVGEIEAGWGGRYANYYEYKAPTLIVTYTIVGLQFSEIQICPWFLAHVRGFKFKDLGDIPSSVLHLASKAILPREVKKNYTPIDTFCLFDKTIVHELTHVDQTVEPANDIQPSPYGFKNARALVADWLRDRSNPNKNPVRNADNCSIFAVGIWIMSHGGGIIGGDGSYATPSVLPMPAATVRRRI